MVLRTATDEDLLFLAEIWSSSLRRGEEQQQLADLATVVSGAAASPRKRVVVAEYDGRPAGAVMLEVGTVSALNLEATVLMSSPTVVTTMRRHGVGQALIEAGLSFAEEHGVTTLATAVGSGAREANRFMARLALSPLGTYRVGPTTAVRARLRGQRPAVAAVGANGRKVTRVVAARRSMRRTRAAG